MQMSSLFLETRISIFKIYHEYLISTKADTELKPKQKIWKCLGQYWSCLHYTHVGTYWYSGRRRSTASHPNSIRKLIQGNWASPPLSRTTKRQYQEFTQPGNLIIFKEIGHIILSQGQQRSGLISIPKLHGLLGFGLNHILGSSKVQMFQMHKRLFKDLIS